MPEAAAAQEETTTRKRQVIVTTEEPVKIETAALTVAGGHHRRILLDEASTATRPGLWRSSWAWATSLFNGKAQPQHEGEPEEVEVRG